MEGQLFILFFVGFLFLCDAEEECPTFLGNEGRCVSLEECEPLKKIAEKRSKVAYEILRKYNCGYDNMDPLVCCPDKSVETNTAIFNDNTCTTLEGEEGSCIDLKDCSHMQKLLNKKFTTEENMGYIKRSKCTPAAPTSSFTVCCKKEAEERTSEDGRQCTLSSTPPAGDSPCCGVESGNDVRIIGGNATSIDQFPWVALIDYTRPEINCGGSLISGKYVLTAAHCLVGRNKVDLKATSVRLGEYNTTNPGTDCTEVPGGGVDCTYGEVSVDIESYVVHEGYDPNHVYKHHDIALIRLKRTVNYTDFIRPICLPSVDFTLTAPDNLTLLVAGWGSFDDTKLPSPVKLYGVLPYVQTEKCHARFSVNRAQSLLDAQICVGGEANKDVCSGDSGGPLMLQKENARFEVVGVISFGSNQCGVENFPSIYTKVYDYLDWIRANIKP